MRLRLGWTQKDLALASGLTQSAIGNYESGQRVEPSGQALVGLAQALKVSPGWLSHGDEAPVLKTLEPWGVSPIFPLEGGHIRPLPSACFPRPSLAVSRVSIIADRASVAFTVYPDRQSPAGERLAGMGTIGPWKAVSAAMVMFRRGLDRSYKTGAIRRARPGNFPPNKLPHATHPAG